MDLALRHKRWLYEESGWSENDQAVFLMERFTGEDFSGCMLRNSCFMECEFLGCTFCGADISESVFTGSGFTDCCFDGTMAAKTDFSGCVFSGSSFVGANVADAIFKGAGLKGTDFRDCVFYGVKVDDGELKKAVNVPVWDNIPIYRCPPEGSFVAWKKVCNSMLLELLIPSDAKRMNMDEKKCRCSKAKVLRIEELSGVRAGVTTVKSLFDREFIYTLGEYVQVPSYGEKNSTAGVYFFMQREDAAGY